MRTDNTDESIRYTADVVLLAAGHVLLIERGWDPYARRWALGAGRCQEFMRQVRCRATRCRLLHWSPRPGPE
ncbi:hypothetical protein ACFV7Q_32615 [Streptomyces sp. NPDC059851]|uniref:hypothetical protein n=1 Tax=Streptomyces sp. NPDC059851 TaxID=3346971 RepID=UPI00365281EF